MVHSKVVSTECRGGCGRTLHVETCAQMGKGAALGNFKCVECRLLDGWSIIHPEQATEQLRNVLARTMVLELSQGKEAMAAG